MQTPHLPQPTGTAINDVWRRSDGRFRAASSLLVLARCLPCVGLAPRIVTEIDPSQTPGLVQSFPRIAAFLLSLTYAGVLWVGAAAPATAVGISDIRNTKHNLSAGSGNAVTATTESQVCVFCHTPHGATPGVAPLWNRRLGTTTYTPYTSSSLDANAIQGGLDQPGGSSKLCLSCHDGTVAIGSVNVLNGVGSAVQQGTQTITMQGTGAGGTMPAGAGTTTGFTRNLGTDLTNDHPISVSYTNALALRDGELRVVDATQRFPAGSGTTIGVRGPSGYRPKVPLEPTGAGGTGQVQCATCHDPHRRETDTTKGNQKFLRLNRFQELPPAPSSAPDTDIICLSCHDKNGISGSYAYSAHANPLVATPTYTATAATQREFPTAIPVWKASCLNCHDTHTVQGARRLLREGTDSSTTPKSGGNSAIEETCYQCHTNAAASVVSPSTTIPDIRTDFQLARHMPIRSIEQNAGTEVHDIAGNFADTFIDCNGPTNGCGKDFLEPRTKLGAADLNMRHAECTDCHNPHRVVKFRSFTGQGGAISGPPDAAGTHPHTDTAGVTHTNIASGVLRGAWGVEPQYGSAAFGSMPTSYTVKRGDPGASADTSAAAAHVTREYQICLKCHSDYGFPDDNRYPIGTRPNLGNVSGTPAGTNNLSQYTNQAMEFQAPANHQGELTTTDSGAGTAFSTNNHRAWHPVVGQTGRTGVIRGNGTDISANWQFPWRNAVGNNTMYCTDCHGSDTAVGTVIPANGENGNPWGPHGSGNNFILKGTWNNATGTGQQATGLCFKCHDYATYATRGGQRTGFFGSEKGDLHSHHADKLGRMRCNWCHVAVPHGWKNKAFLVNLNDVGGEAGLAPGTQVRNNTTAAYNQGPYYMNAVLKIRSFARSGQWLQANCGSVGAPGNGQSGRTWMRDSTENCVNAP
jgi:doubled CXXCH motif protein